MSTHQQEDPAASGWDRFRHLHLHDTQLGISLDVSRMGLTDAFLQEKSAAVTGALEDMRRLEGGAIANPDEGRMVGHYWLRDPATAPTDEIRAAISTALDDLERFVAEVHDGTVTAPGGGRFTGAVCIGIGGSSLGPRFVCHALAGLAPAFKVWFIDNTDPDGFDQVLADIGDGLNRTLAIVTSKSGTTPEPLNAMKEVQAAYEAASLDFGAHAVAVTSAGSVLHELAANWLARFPMWDWVGGRTSVFSVVGLLPAALQHIPIRDLLSGARDMDTWTRATDPLRNPAALLALGWYHATGGRGEKDMVVLPYKDRLELIARYLQQLIMESLGKQREVDEETTHQGITVYGNKGSTDQHAFVQQLREGIPNFFVTFIEILKDRDGALFEVDDDVTSGDFLSGFLLGTRAALHEAGRASMTITLDDLAPDRIGALIALFERAVGLYASLIGINAYHQPGVEAGKKAAAEVIAQQRKIMTTLRDARRSMTLEEIGQAAGTQDTERIYLILRHLSANRPEIQAEGEPDRPLDRRWRWDDA